MNSDKTEKNMISVSRMCDYFLTYRLCVYLSTNASNDKKQDFEKKQKTKQQHFIPSIT